MESSPETSITDDFNPYATTQAAYGMGATGLIYEPLVEFNLASTTVQYPWLATKYAWSNGGKTITFTIRQGVKWSDGTPFSAADVAFTFNLLKANAAANSNGLAITGVVELGQSGHDQLLLSPVHKPAVHRGRRHRAGVGLEQGGQPGDVHRREAGRHRHELGSFTAQGFTLVKNPHYWQPSKVKVTKVYFPAYTSNTGALSALFSGQIDWTGNYIPGLKKNFVNTYRRHHHYYEAANGDESLEPNLTKWPLSDLAVRKAVSLAVNRTTLGAEGKAGLESPVTNATGLTLPAFQAWAAPVASMTVSPHAQTAAAKKVIEQAGFKMGSNGFFQQGGKTVSLTIIKPVGLHRHG